MKKFSLIIFGILMFIVTSLFSFENINKEKTIIIINGNSAVYSDGLIFYYGDKLNGIVEEFLPSGNIKSRTQYRDGMKQGEEILFFPDGKIYSECNYEKNLINGKYTGYYSDGRIKFSYNYSEGKLNGECADYYEQGQQGIIKNFSYGKEQGSQKELRRDGKILKNYNVKNDRKYGLDNESQDCVPVRKSESWQ